MLFKNFCLIFVIFTLAILMAVFMIGCGSSSPSDNNSDGGSNNNGQVLPNTVTIENFAFNPANLTVVTGTTVTWTNRDSVAHTVVANNGSFKSGNLNKGESFSFKFDNEGVYDYYCSIHPSMKGVINVNKSQ